MKCPKCGRIIDDDSKYCDYCGTKVLQVNTLKKEPQLVESNSLPEQDDGLQKHEIWLGIIVILLPLLLMSILAYLDLDKNPNGTGSNELNLVDTVAMADTTTMANQQIDFSIVEFMTYIKVVADSVAKEQCQKEEAEKQAALKSQGWVDLGLPSGTEWKNSNEEGFYSFYEALKAFGDSLPTKEQLEELEDKCTWTWTGDGNKVEGPNGNFIFMPAVGFSDCTGRVDYVSYTGSFWSSTKDSLGYVMCLSFSFGNAYMFKAAQCEGLSVRLVR